ncbi:MAG: sugar ABC transporter ATP-binding protein [Planctomycetes bacterium]|nr:sugar ABC transporter ATP-binding protein [Planctomycetota bacterium]
MTALLRLDGISKKFGAFYALREVSFEIYGGEVNVLIGENGAGKSTLMKILSGVYARDAGRVTMDGREVSIASPMEAERLGIGTVYQELTLAPELSVAENFFLGASLITRCGFVQWRRLREEAGRQLRHLVGLDVDPAAKVRTLGVAQQQMLEIARTVHRNTRVLVLDEPTAVLTNREVEKLFEIIQAVKARGIAVVYISHRLEELFRIGDRVTVLRDGRLVGSRWIREIDTNTLIHMMVGRSIDNQYPRADFSTVPRRETLRVENLRRGKAVRDVSFVARSGEILGFAGLVGAGRTETARVIFGADAADAGALFVQGNRVTIRATRDAIRHGIALLPEDRKGQGLVLNRPVRENVTIVTIRSFCNRLGLLRRRREKEVAQAQVARFRIAVRDVEAPVSSLSGGNQQKVVIAKWILAEAEIIIFDEPTRGIDVGAKTEVYGVMNAAVLSGKTVIVISSELMELIGMCDRIYTMHGGRITGEFDNTGTPVTEDELLTAMME